MTRRIAPVLTLSHGVLFALILAASVRSTGAAPDWVRAAISDDPSGWTRRESGVMLLRSIQVRYLPGGRLVEVERGVLRTAADDQIRVNLSSYNPNTDRVLSRRAWTQSADAQKFRECDDDEFVDQVAQYNHYFWDSRRLLLLTTGHAGIGGIVAWEIQMEYQYGIRDCSAVFRSREAVLRSVFEVVPEAGSQLEWHATSERLRSPVPGTDPGSLKWELTRLAPARGVPSWFIPDPLEVSVRCKPPGSARTTWREISELAAGIMEPRVDTGGEVKAQAEALVAGKSRRWDRIRALTEFVQRQIVYLEFTLDRDNLAGYRPHRATDVLRNRFGDCKDKATLLVSMLRAIGEDGRIVLLTAANPRAVNSDWPSAQFNHAIVAIPADSAVPAQWPVVEAGALGKLVIFDPTDSATPLGICSQVDQGGWALVVDPGKGALVRLPWSDPAYSGHVRHLVAAIDRYGNLRVSGDENFSGLAAAEVYSGRLQHSRLQFTRHIELQVHESCPLAQSIAWSDDWKPASAKYSLHFEFTAARYGRPMPDGLMLVSPEFFPYRTKLEPWKTDQDGVVALGPSSLDEEVRLKPPPNFVVEELPDPWVVESPNLSCRLSYRVEGGDVLFRIHFVHASGFFGKADYEALRDQIQKMEAAESRPILIRNQIPPAHS